jgi:hypothetical protein
MEELANFKFKSETITATFDAFDFEIKGSFSEKEIDNFKLKLKEMENENINLENTALILSAFEEADDIAYILFKNRSLKEEEIYEKIVNAVCTFKTFSEIHKIEIIKNPDDDSLVFLPLEESFKMEYKNSKNTFSYIKGKESIKISNEELEVLEKEIKEYKNSKKTFNKFSKEIKEAIKKKKTATKLPVQQKQVEIISSSIKILNDYESNKMEYDLDLMIELEYWKGKKELISWNRKKLDEVELISEFEEFAIVDLEKMRCAKINVYLIFYGKEGKHLTSAFPVSDNQMKIIDRLSKKELFNYRLPKTCFKEEYTSLKVGTFERNSNSWIFKIKEKFGFLTLERRINKKTFANEDQLVESNGRNSISRIDVSLFR